MTRDNKNHNKIAFYKNKTWIVAMFLVVVSIFGFVWVSQGLAMKNHFPVNWVEIQGEFKYVSPDHIKMEILPHTNLGFFAMNLQTMRHIIEDIPWVASASVRKRWPDTLIIHITEHKPYAIWGVGGLINQHNELFIIPEEFVFADLPILSGPEERFAEVIHRYHQMRNDLASIGLDILQIQLSERGAWEIKFDNDMKLKLGKENITSRFQSFINSYSQLSKLQSAHGSIVDFRYTNGFAIHWNEPLTVASNDEFYQESQTW